jgi:propanol-preferring alcohol dehydrogenase
MRAKILPKVVRFDEQAAPLNLAELPIPEAQPKEVRLRVTVCGVCHTELDEIEGRAPPPHLPVVLGHQVVGYVDQLGTGVKTLRLGDRVGVGWVHSSTGGTDENLSTSFRATGRDTNGGYAEYMTVPEQYAYPIPAIFSDSEAAPLLCAGAVGYRAVKLTGLKDGERLGLMGFGGSAHLVLQMVRSNFPNSRIYVFARDRVAREFAIQLGANWAGEITECSPEPLHAIIDTTPAWRPAIESLSSLCPGGRLVINAIRKEDADKESLLSLRYHDHLWMEREIKTVANVTHHDIREFLPMAADIPIRPQVTTYRLEDANRALYELKYERVKGAKVLCIN